MTRFVHLVSINNGLSYSADICDLWQNKTKTFYSIPSFSFIYKKGKDHIIENKELQFGLGNLFFYHLHVY